MKSEEEGSVGPAGINENIKVPKLRVVYVGC